MNPPDRSVDKERRLDQWSKDAHKAWQQDGHLGSTQAVYTSELSGRFQHHKIEDYSDSAFPLRNDQRVTAAPTSILPSAKLNTFQSGVYKPNVDALRREMRAGTYEDRGKKNPWTTVDEEGRTWLRNGHHRATAAYLENKPMSAIVYNQRDSTTRKWLNRPETNVNTRQITSGLRRMGYDL